MQHKIVEQITEEQKIVDTTKRLIDIFEQKIKDKIAEVWGEPSDKPLEITPQQELPLAT